MAKSRTRTPAPAQRRAAVAPRARSGGALSAAQARPARRAPRSAANPLPPAARPAPSSADSSQAAALKSEAAHLAAGHRWTFLTNHAHVLILLARNPSLILRTVAQQVGITERAVQRIIADLHEDGYLERTRVGRRNQYRVRSERPLRHPIESHRTIGALIRLVDQPEGSK